MVLPCWAVLVGTYWVNSAVLHSHFADFNRNVSSFKIHQNIVINWYPTQQYHPSPRLTWEFHQIFRWSGWISFFPNQICWCMCQSFHIAKYWPLWSLPDPEKNSCPVKIYHVLIFEFISCRFIFYLRELVDHQKAFFPISSVKAGDSISELLEDSTFWWMRMRLAAQNATVNL